MNAVLKRSLRNTFFTLIIIVLTGLCIELMVRLAAKAGLCHIRTFQVAQKGDEIRYVGDINKHFGVWHVPNVSVAVHTPEGKITYETNAQGMRDRARAERSTASERVVVLGDSFVEGNYVEEEDRVTDVLEKQTGIEFLNFGTSGSFGSIQEWLLYKHLASQFDHSRVLVFFLPDNDFADNDPAGHPAKRYRPYLRKTGDSYEVTYPTSFGAGPATLLKMSKGRQFRHKVYNSWYTANLLVYRDFDGEADIFQDRTTTSSYDEFTDEDLSRLVFSYRQILEAAKPRPVTIFVIPRDRDFIAYEQGRFEGKITKALVKFAENTDGVEIVDMMPTYLAYMKENKISHKPFFLKFDGHWSPLGHRVAANAVLDSIDLAPGTNSQCKIVQYSSANH